MDWTSIVLGVMTLLGGCGWIIDRKKHRQEVESLKADNRLKDMELAQTYVEQFENGSCYKDRTQQQQHVAQAPPDGIGTRIGSKTREHAG